MINEVKPNYIFVHGDTTTSSFGAIAAFYNQISVGHVEAGLRTFDKYSPFPEEMNHQSRVELLIFILLQLMKLKLIY